VSPVLVVGRAGGVRLGASEGGALVCKQRYASEAMSMSDQDDWELAGPEDAKAEIRAAVGYLLRSATGGAVMISYMRSLRSCALSAHDSIWESTGLTRRLIF
jgi:hypothetical protein